VGAYLYRDSTWRLSAALSADLARRKESDDPRLQGLGDVRRTASFGVAASYTLDWLTARARVATDILGRDQGTLARLDTLARWRAGDRLSFFAGPGATWADGRYTRTFFGVDAGQSARSGLPQFEAKGGLNSVRFSVGANYRIDLRWRLGAFASYSKLKQDAAASPITEDQSQRFVGVFVSYRFGNPAGFQDAQESP
jgi:outer membrane protein